MAGVDTVTRRFLGTVEAHGDVTALLDPFDQERQWTFTRFADDVATVAAGLAGRGVGRGDRVGRHPCHRGGRRLRRSFRGRPPACAGARDNRDRRRFVDRPVVPRARRCRRTGDGEPARGDRHDHLHVGHDGTGQGGPDQPRQRLRHVGRGGRAVRPGPGRQAGHLVPADGPHRRAGGVALFATAARVVGGAVPRHPAVPRLRRRRAAQRHVRRPPGVGEAAAGRAGGGVG